MLLRPFQEDIVERARLELRTHRSVLIQSATGSGKTVLSAFMMRSARSKGLRAWFIAHRDFLLDQTSQTFTAAGLDHAFIAAGWPYSPHHPTQICSIGTLAKRLDRLDPPDLIVWDEGHHIAAGSYEKVFKWASRAKHVILSATPTRLDGKGLDDYAGAIVCGPSVSWLMEEGYLSRYRAYAPSVPDLTGVHTRMGDYAVGELDAAMDKSVLIGDMVGHYSRLAHGRKAIYFAVSVKHSQHIAATFNAAGIPAVHIDGTTPRHERAMAARAMARGEILVIVNCSLATEGYDLAAQAGMPVTIECVGLARPTQSVSLYLQMVGRALRPKPEPAIILDHAALLVKHGLPDDDREWTLKGIEKAARTSAGGVRTCSECFGAFPSTSPKCPYCGHDHRGAVTAGRVVEEIAGELEEVDPAKLREARKAEERSARSVEDLITLGKKRGYSNPVAWAGHIASARATRSRPKHVNQAAHSKWW